jgi:lipopolysaccharide export system ATP-binding protein
MILRTENLVKTYGRRTVANHVSINVTQGEIVGLLGPNGAGKTTTFYMTTGLITPNEGEIFLDDLNITKYPVYKRAQNGIGYLAQEPSVFRKLSVEDNIRAVLQMTKLTREEQRDKLESAQKPWRPTQRRRAPTHRNCPMPCHQPALHHARRAVCRR